LNALMRAKITHVECEVPTMKWELTWFM